MNMLFSPLLALTTSSPVRVAGHKLRYGKCCVIFRVIKLVSTCSVLYEGTCRLCPAVRCLLYLVISTESGSNFTGPPSRNEIVLHFLFVQTDKLCIAQIAFRAVDQYTPLFLDDEPWERRLVSLSNIFSLTGRPMDFDPLTNMNESRGE